MTVIASAPGKIVLSGEYAVLWGAPAVCMAVDRRAVATVQPADACSLTTPGFTDSDPFRVVDALSPGGRPACDITLDTTAFANNGSKIGLGSSAALTVALAAALDNSVEIYEQTLAAHKRLQGNSGSGVDVAAAVHGGLLEYSMTSREAASLPWPNGLAFRVIWTGVPVSTGEKLKKLAAQAGQPAMRSRSALLLVAPRMAQAWRSADAGAILETYVTYIGVLRQFSVDHDLGIFDAGHDKLTDAAMADGLVYKPSGAGGGDIGMLFGRSDSELDAFLAKRADLVHRVIACELDPDGVRLERQ